MKKFSQFNKKIFALSLVGMLALGVLSGCASSNLKVIPKDIDALKALLQEKGNFKVSESILDENGDQEATGMYADTTPDGKVNWNEENDYETVSPKAEEISKNITLDDKKIALPMTFSDLGEQYAEFNNVDFSKLNNDMAPIIIENTKTKMNMLVLNTDAMPINATMGFDQEAVIVDLLGGGTHKISVGINLKDKKILTLSTNGASFSSERDLKINGIGVGNTFNEMYAKFGNPVKIQKNEMGHYTDTMAMYAYTDEKGNMYGAYFVHSDKKFDGKNYIKTKPNVITAVNIFYLSNNK
ncbi:putative lipoprotein [Peptostreptococcaceae bacterium AS15]|nr:putative lipoprotein [Peptostreptococcaceae bacterium AS15]